MLLVEQPIGVGFSQAGVVMDLLVGYGLVSPGHGLRASGGRWWTTWGRKWLGDAGCGLT